MAENYTKEKFIEDDVPPVTLGSDEYYVMGDNRKNSDDSRNNGAVKSDWIFGRAALVFYPLGRFGRMADPGYPAQ